MNKEGEFIMRWLASVFIFCFSCISVTQSAVIPDNVVYAKGTFFGNANNDAYLLSMAMDKNGYIYGTGVCTSIPTTTGAYNERNNGGFDVMVFKLDPTMTFLIWATYIGGSGNDGGGSIAVNDAGEVFVSGYTYSSNFPYTGSFGLDLQYLQTQVVCYYALKLSADGGQLLYSRILGGGIQMMIETENATKGANIAINSAGEAFVFANTQSTSPYMLTGNAFQVIPGGSIDAMFTKLGARGDLLYSTYVGGFNDEEANGICYANGKIYCIGTTGSNNFPKQTNRQPDNADSYILMWEDGQTPRLVKSYIYGCDGNDRGLSVYYDRMYNRLLFTGRTSNSTINATSTLLTGHPYGGYVGAIDDSLGVIQFLTIISKGAMPTACMPRRNGSIYVGGYVDGLLPVTANAYQGVPMGGMDGMLVAVTADGSNLLYGSYVGGTNNDYAIANIIITEEMVCSLEVLFGITTHSLDYPSTIDTYQPLKLNAGEDQPSISRFTIPQEKEFMFHAHKACGEDTFRIVFPCLQPQSIMWSFSDIPLVEYNVTQLSHRFPANGTYKVIVRLAYPNNVVFREFNVTVNSYPNIKATQNKIYLCNKNNSVMLNATGGKRYRWFPGKSVSDSTIPNPVVKPTQPNTWYYVRGWDEKGCVSVDSVQVIIVPTTLKVSKDTTICNGQRAKLHADGVNKIFWSPVLGLDRDNGNDVFAKPNVTTTYYATSSNGQCIDTSTVTVYVAQPPKIEFPQAPTTCTGGTVLLQIKAIGNQTIDTAGVQFRWRADNDLLVVSPSDAQVTPLTSKWYWVTATNKYGCTFTDSVYVQVKNTLTVTASNDTTLCLGSSIQLWAAGAATYTWFPPDGLDNPTSPNPTCSIQHSIQYRVIGVGGICSDTNYVNITVDTVAVNAGKDTSVCINQQVMFKVQNVQSAYQYTWEPKADFQNPNGAVVTLLATQTKDYIVTATNSTGCSSSDTIHVDTDHSLQVELGADTTICSGGSHTILITTQNDVSTTYQWFPNNGVFDQSTLRYVVTPQQTTMYKVVAQNGTCTGVDSVLVTVQNGIDLAINSDTVVCSNTPFPIKVTSLQDSVEYRWIRGGTLDTMVDNPLIATPISKGIVQPTWYTVIATAKGCTSIDSFLITTHPAQVVKLSAERTVCVGDTIHVHVTADKITSVVWQPDVDITSISPTVVVITVNKEQTYSVTVCDSSGCCKVETYTTHIEPANQVTIGVVSIDSIAGRYATLYVVANGTTTINSGLQYDVEINADIFLPTPPSRITNKIRTIHRALGQTPITNAESIIDSIPGTLLMSEVLSSDVTIQNLVIDSVNCLQVIPNHGIIKVNSCADNIRAIKLFETLQAVITPNPVGSNAELHISSYVAGVCRYALYNQLGKEILRGSIDKNQQHIATTLHLPDVSAGVYRITISDGNQTIVLPFVKE